MNAKVVVQLHQFCDRLEVPRETSVELVSFLTVKTILGQNRAADLSPSSTVDKLLHAVLLDTEVRKSVEELVGEIHHRELTAELPDELKMERRLAAMNAMSKEGFEPNVTLWEEPGTLMHSITIENMVDQETGKRSTVFSSVWKQGPGLRRITSEKTSKGHDGQARPKKRSRQCITDQAKSMVVSIKDLAREFTVRVNLSGQPTVMDLMEAIEKQEGIPSDRQRLIVQGKPLPEAMALKAGLDQGIFDKVVYLMLRMRGC